MVYISLSWYDIPEFVVCAEIFPVDTKWHKWPLYIGSVCRNHNPVLSSFMTYHRVCKKNNTTGATCGAGTAYPFDALSSSLFFIRVHVVRSFVFCAVCPFSFGHCIARPFSDCIYDIFKLFLTDINCIVPGWGINGLFGFNINETGIKHEKFTMEAKEDSGNGREHFLQRFTRRVPRVQQELLPFLSTWVHPRYLMCVRITLYIALVLCACFVDRCLSLFFWPLCCLIVFDLRILPTALVFSISS
jgi:hypothetical protein